MTARAGNRIQWWLWRLGQTGNDMKREDICFLMVQVRHLIETEGARERFRVANFYADWVVHPALDRSLIGAGILRDIHSLVLTDYTRPDLITEISRIIGLPKLRADLRTLFQENDLPLFLFDDRENWRHAAAALLWLVADGPVGFRKDMSPATRKINDEMVALERPHDVMLESVSVGHREGRWYWVLTLSQGGSVSSTIQAEVRIAEAADAFPLSSGDAT